MFFPEKWSGREIPPHEVH